MINITKYASFNMDVNTYILAKNNRVLIIDPGFNGEKIINHINNYCMKIEGIIFTHGHYDHIKDLTLLLDPQVPIYIHEDEVDFLYNPDLNLSSMFNQKFILGKDMLVKALKDGEKIKFQNEVLKTIHLPGHTKGSMGIIYNQHFFSGDTLFYDSIGRTDLPTGNGGKIFASLKKIKETLSKSTICYPGHGKGGRLLEIMAKNPYFSNIN